MPLFLLEKGEFGQEGFEGKVIRARTEQRARNIADMSIGDGEEGVWSDPSQVTCKKIFVSGNEEEVIRAFLNE